jgi:hypothetical protein
MLKTSKIVTLVSILLFLIVNCGDSADGIDDTPLSEEYPGDVGMEHDPAVIWMENFVQNFLVFCG